MGNVELKDQITGLQKAITTFDFIDDSRVAITGWSYGGYMALLGIAMYPHIFKVQVSKKIQILMCLISKYISHSPLFPRIHLGNIICHIFSNFHDHRSN